MSRSYSAEKQLHEQKFSRRRRRALDYRFLIRMEIENLAKFRCKNFRLNSAANALDQHRRKGKEKTHTHKKKPEGKIQINDICMHTIVIWCIQTPI